MYHYGYTCSNSNTARMCRSIGMLSGNLFFEDRMVRVICNTLNFYRRVSYEKMF